MNDREKYAVVAARMKKYRERAGIKAGDMHIRMGLPTRQAFYGYESGKQPISMLVFFNWCNALNLKIRSVAESIEEELSGVKRCRLPKREQELRAAKALIAKNEGN